MHTKGTIFVHLYQYLPSRESRPHAIQMMKLMPTEPVRSKSPEGDTKIPEPSTEQLIISFSKSILQKIRKYC